MADNIDVHHYRCVACGGTATWRPATQQVSCRSCGAIVPLPAADSTRAASFFLVPYLRNSPENRRAVIPERLVRPCPTCGHDVVFAQGIEGTMCQACLTPLLRSPHPNDAPIRPTGVVPFMIDEADAQARVRAWWREKRRRSPGIRRLDHGPVVARYIPVWQFSVRVHCRWRHTATDDDGGERVTEGTVRGDYGEREPGNQHLPASLLAALPFPFEHAVAFDRRYLAGAMVEQHDGNIFRAWDAAHARLQALVDPLVDREAGAFKRPQERWPSMSQEKGWLILAPFYTANVEINGTRHHIVVDGHGGGVASDIPEAFPIGALLVAVTLFAMLIALGWWGVTWLVGP